MIDHIDAYRDWWTAGAAFILVTITDVRQSAPLPPGHTMAVGPATTTGQVREIEDLQVVGSVSGGCIESDVLYRAFDMLVGDTKVSAARFGFSEETAFAHGLTCGGELEVLLERVDSTDFPQFGNVCTNIAAGRTVTLATEISRSQTSTLDRAVDIDGVSRSDRCTPASVALDAFLEVSSRAAQRDSALVEVAGAAGSQVFVRRYTPAPRMIIFGAIDFAAALSRVAKDAGYHVTICDARATFATDVRFPDADSVVVDWPHRYLEEQLGAAGNLDHRTALCVLTHDLKYDVPLLNVALRSSVNYVGAMGSRRTHAERTRALLDSGLLTAGELDRIYSPIGLDLGGSSPGETAISIMAEVLAARYDGTGRPLSHVTSPIHRDRAPLAEIST